MVTFAPVKQRKISNHYGKIIKTISDGTFPS